MSLHKETSLDFDIIAFNLYINFVSIAILTMLILIQEHGVSLYLFRPFKIYFNNVWRFQSIHFAFFVKFVLQLCYFWCYNKWNCFLNFIFWFFILVVYRFFYIDLVPCNHVELVHSNVNSNIFSGFFRILYMQTHVIWTIYCLKLYTYIRIKLI